MPDTNRGRVRANQERARAGAARTAAQARDALARECTPQARIVLQARIDHPEATLTEVAAHLGMSKARYSNQLYRALAGRPVGTRPRRNHPT